MRPFLFCDRLCFCCCITVSHEPCKWSEHPFSHYLRRLINSYAFNQFSCDRNFSFPPPHCLPNQPNMRKTTFVFPTIQQNNLTIARDPNELAHNVLYQFRLSWIYISICLSLLHWTPLLSTREGNIFSPVLNVLLINESSVLGALDFCPEYVAVIIYSIGVNLDPSISTQTKSLYISGLNGNVGQAWLQNKNKENSIFTEWGCKGLFGLIEFTQICTDWPISDNDPSQTKQVLIIK